MLLLSGEIGGLNAERVVRVVELVREMRVLFAVAHSTRVDRTNRGNMLGPLLEAGPGNDSPISDHCRRKAGIFLDAGRNVGIVPWQLELFASPYSGFN